MHSNEVAKLAGVTVRTLRHYHSIGLLPEPPRSANGYREYGALDLARLLRIKRLAGLGFPLSRIGEMLGQMDGSGQASDRASCQSPVQASGEAFHRMSGEAFGQAPGQSPDQERCQATDQVAGQTPSLEDALDGLDRELELQIQYLQEQRRTIQLLKREQLDPDLPVRFARSMKLLAGVDEGRAAVSQTDRAAVVLAGHLYTEQDLEEFERVAQAVAQRGLADRLDDVSRRFDNLAPDADQAARDALVDDAVAVLAQLSDCFNRENWERPCTPEELLIERAASDTFNAAQQDAYNRLYLRMEQMILSKTS